MGKGDWAILVLLAYIALLHDHDVSYVVITW